MPTTVTHAFTVGREQQLLMIDSLLSNIVSRDGGSLLFSGEPGIGKSHLLRETMTRAKQLLIRTISLRCSESDINDPFALFSRLGALFDIPEPESFETNAARFRTVDRRLTPQPSTRASSSLMICNGVTISVLSPYCTSSITEPTWVLVFWQLLDLSMTLMKQEQLSRSELCLN